jgi:MFS family permease
MGATIPIGMSAIRETMPREAGRSFSSLYSANVAGAVIGTVLPLLLIELFGFHRTLWVGAACNGGIAAAAIMLSRNSPSPEESPDQSVKPSARSIWTATSGGAILTLLFLTGLTSMGMEVIWVRQFTPYLGTMVYAFAGILGVYLAATFLGSRIYRGWNSRRAENAAESPVLWTLLALSALLPLVMSSPEVRFSGALQELRVVVGIVPFTALLGFLTPMLVDRRSGGDPGKAGSAYAVNIAGCILGPLLAGFLLLPYWSERWSLIALTSPWIIVGLRTLRPSPSSTLVSRSAAYALVPLAVLLIMSSRGYDEIFPRRQVLRDATATVIATGRGI